jgi:hypothetical protein
VHLHSWRIDAIDDSPIEVLLNFPIAPTRGDEVHFHPSGSQGWYQFGHVLA